jgi:hypothetical protein
MSADYPKACPQKLGDNYAAWAKSADATERFAPAATVMQMEQGVLSIGRKDARLSATALCAAHSGHACVLAMERGGKTKAHRWVGYRGLAQ